MGPFSLALPFGVYYLWTEKSKTHRKGWQGSISSVARLGFYNVSSSTCCQKHVGEKRKLMRICKTHPSSSQEFVQNEVTNTSDLVKSFRPAPVLAIVAGCSLYLELVFFLGSSNSLLEVGGGEESCQQTKKNWGGGRGRQGEGGGGRESVGRAGEGGGGQGRAGWQGVQGDKACQVSGRPVAVCQAAVCEEGRCVFGGWACLGGVAGVS